MKTFVRLMMTALMALTLIACGGHSLVFGGGKQGLMGACARGVLREGGKALVQHHRCMVS